jgi:uncharacterized membrane protein YfcA
MLGGIIVGIFGVLSLAFLTWLLIKTYNNPRIDDGTRFFRTAIIGLSYTLQLAIMVFLSTAGKAYQWFRSESVVTRADNPYVIGIAVGIFLGAGLLQLFLSRQKNH